VIQMHSGPTETRSANLWQWIASMLLQAAYQVHASFAVPYHMDTDDLFW
jgi:hypothetical protein